MSRVVFVDGTRLSDRQSCSLYMREMFDLPAHASRDLDSLEKMLVEDTSDTQLWLTRKCISTICASGYGYEVLMMLGRVCDKNPHMKIVFT